MSASGANILCSESEDKLMCRLGAVGHRERSRVQGVRERERRARPWRESSAWSLTSAALPWADQQFLPQFGHIAISVNDVQEECDRLEKLGVEFKKRPQDGKMKHIAFIYDPDHYWCVYCFFRSRSGRVLTLVSGRIEIVPNGGKKGESGM